MSTYKTHLKESGKWIELHADGYIGTHCELDGDVVYIKCSSRKFVEQSLELTRHLEDPTQWIKNARRLARMLEKSANKLEHEFQLTIL